jgi:hypothetical protein
MRARVYNAMFDDTFSTLMNRLFRSVHFASLNAGLTCAISARCLTTTSPCPIRQMIKHNAIAPGGIDPLANEGIDRRWKNFYIRKMGIHVRKHTIYAELPSHLKASQRLRMVTVSAMRGSDAVPRQFSEKGPAH